MERIELDTEVLSNMTCFQTAFLPICIENNIDPLIMSLWGWNFLYVSGEKIFDNFFSKYSTDPNSFFLKYMGLEIVDIKDNSDFINIIDTRIKCGDWIICGIDAFYCPWDYSYLKMHIDHFFLAKKVDFERKKLKCIDWFVDKEKEFEISFDEIIGRVEVVKIVKLVEMPEKNNALKELLKGYENEESIIRYFNYFAQDILNVERYEELFENSDIKLCNLLIELRKNRDYRVCIYKYLRKISNPEINEFIATFGELCEKWEKLLFAFIKVFLRKTINDKTKRNIADMIVAIGSVEKYLYSNIKHYTNLLR